MSKPSRRRALASLLGAAGLASAPAVLRAQGQAQGPAMWAEARTSIDGPACDNRQDPCDVLPIHPDGGPQIFNSDFKHKERA